ncbi:MAG: hypothetical protein ACXAEU_05310 [Candidatus Hodarchaeales archaeon]
MNSPPACARSFFLRVVEIKRVTGKDGIYKDHERYWPEHSWQWKFKEGT